LQFSSLWANTPATAFFSTAAWLSPDCVFAPLNSTTLASGVKLLASTKTTFAVRSGGHMPIPGFASTDHGVMIATTHLNEKTIVTTPNEFGVSYLRAGSSFRWQQLYEFLNPHGLVVVGGRVASVGSSLILGGGLSYHSYQYGWAANNVVNFELVTGNGTILQVNKASYPDLFWALKGGSNNFGIVTRYDLRTYPSGPMYGGSVSWTTNATQQYLDAFAAYLALGGGIDDPKANMMPSFSYTPSTGTVSQGNVYVYNGKDSSPKAFENFTTIPTTSSQLGVMNFSQITAQTEFFADLVNR
jgi:FAD/FMN-containing dehydrogenase